VIDKYITELRKAMMEELGKEGVLLTLQQKQFDRESITSIVLKANAKAISKLSVKDYELIISKIGSKKLRDELGGIASKLINLNAAEKVIEVSKLSEELMGEIVKVTSLFWRTADIVDSFKNDNTIIIYN
jgi:hypothetical protein